MESSMPAHDMPSVGIEILPHAEGLPGPRAMTEGAAGYDLHAAVDAGLVIEPGRVQPIPTGVRVEIPPGYEAQVRPRSGLALRQRIGVLNSPGTIDSDYRGEVQVLLFNFGDRPFRVERGARIAQLVFAQVFHPRFEARSLGETRRGAGGFGHTNT
jgi:dUTP pyrophosphatase